MATVGPIQPKRGERVTSIPPKNSASVPVVKAAPSGDTAQFASSVARAEAKTNLGSPVGPRPPIPFYSEQAQAGIDARTLGDGGLDGVVREKLRTQLQLRTAPGKLAPEASEFAATASRMQNLLPADLPEASRYRDMVGEAMARGPFITQESMVANARELRASPPETDSGFGWLSDLFGVATSDPHQDTVESSVRSALDLANRQDAVRRNGMPASNQSIRDAGVGRVAELKARISGFLPAEDAALFSAAADRALESWAPSR